MKVVTALVEAEDKNGFMQLGDHVRDKLASEGVVVLATELQGQATLLVTVTADLVASKRLHAGNLVKAGDKVTVVIGEFRVEDLIVE